MNRRFLLPLLVVVLACVAAVLPHRRAAFRGGYTPADSPVLQVWLKSDTEVYKDAGSTLSGDGDRAQEWHDQGPEGNDLVRSSSFELCPTNRTGQLDGFPGIECDGTGENLPFASTLQHDSNYTMTVVFDPTTVDGTHYLLSNGSVDGLIRSPFAGNEIYLRLSSADETDVTVNLPVEPAYVTLVRNLGDYEIFTNGVSAGTGTAIASRDHQTDVISSVTVSLDFKGYFYEIIINKTNLTSSELDDLFGYIKDRYPSLPQH